MVTPQKKIAATLQKLFVIDEQGAFVGEYVIDDDCTVGFDDFVNAVGNMAMEDSQTVFVGECKATILHGAQLSLIAISKGPLGSQELTWAKTTLTAVETSLTKKIEALKAGSKAEEVETGEAASKVNSDVSSDELKERLEQAELQLAQERKSVMEKVAEVQTKDETLRELEATVSTAKETEEQLLKEIEALSSELDAVKAKIPSDLEQAQKDVEMRVKILQRKAFELLEREEKLRKREQELLKSVAGE